MSESREQKALFLSSELINSNAWIDSLNSYNELGGSSVMFSHDSLDCLSWAQGNGSCSVTLDRSNKNVNGRPDSPTVFDHEEVMHIDVGHMTA